MKKFTKEILFLAWWCFMAWTMVYLNMTQKNNHSPVALILYFLAAVFMFLGFLFIEEIQMDIFATIDISYMFLIYIIATIAFNILVFIVFLLFSD